MNTMHQLLAPHILFFSSENHVKFDLTANTLVQTI
jgi:hypothetical protein